MQIKTIYNIGEVVLVFDGVNYKAGTITSIAIYIDNDTKITYSIDTIGDSIPQDDIHGRMMYTKDIVNKDIIKQENNTKCSVWYKD